MPRRLTRAAARAAVHRRCTDPGDTRELRVDVLAALESALDVTAYVWVLTDPRSEVGVDPLARIPDLAAVPRLVRLKYLTATNRWTRLATEPVSLGDSRDRSLLWRDALAGYGVADVASVVFRDRHGCWGFLDLWSARAFSPDDLGLLRAITAPVTAALRAGRAATFMTADRDPTAIDGPAILLLDDDLRITGRTAASTEWEQLLLPRADGAPVPAAAFNVAAQLLARERGVDDHEPMARTHVADGLWLTLRASRVEPDHLITVTVERSTGAERLEVFARATGLSPRETELLEQVIRGADTAEIAARLHLSAYTVQDHLTAVFDKTGVRSRRELVSRVSGSG